MGSDEGVSLPELLVTMAIFSIVMSVVFSAMIAIEKQTAKVQNSAQAISQVRLGLAQIDKQVRSGNVLYSPADEPASVPSCTASGTSGTCMRVYTQTNGTQRCVQWQVLADPAKPGTSLLRSRGLGAHLDDRRQRLGVEHGGAGAGGQPVGHAVHPAGRGHGVQVAVAGRPARGRGHPSTRQADRDQLVARGSQHQLRLRHRAVQPGAPRVMEAEMRRNLEGRPTGDEGVALVAAVAVVMLVTLLMGTLIAYAVSETRQTGRDRQRSSAVMRAEGSVDHDAGADAGLEPGGPAVRVDQTNSEVARDTTAITTTVTYYNAAGTVLACPLAAGSLVVQALVKSTATTSSLAGQAAAKRDHRVAGPGEPGAGDEQGDLRQRRGRDQPAPRRQRQRARPQRRERLQQRPRQLHRRRAVQRLADRAGHDHPGQLQRGRQRLGHHRA